MKENPFLSQILSIIKANLYNDDFKLEHIWQSVYMSKANFYRKYEAIGDIHLKLNDLVFHVRLNKAAELLCETDDSIAEIGFLVCFKNAGHFTRKFTAQFGMTPSAYREKCKNETERD